MTNLKLNFPYEPKNKSKYFQDPIDTETQLKILMSLIHLSNSIQIFHLRSIHNDVMQGERGYCFLTQVQNVDNGQGIRV